ncbi:MAG: 30S ribosomal protein S7 [Planctomycetes bacterium]|nr:30S ribosomal protein S7 [Planctomycetota bacterium]
MGRKKYTKSREQLKPDSRFSSLMASKFINCLMYDGRKTAASRVFYDAMDVISKRIDAATPIEVFETAINNVKPNIEVRSKRVGGSNYQVPMQVSRKRQQSLSIRWILQAVRGRSGKATSQFLAQELMDAYKREGTAMTTRENVHRMADANKAFAHFAW